MQEGTYFALGVGARQWSGKSCTFLDLDKHTEEQAVEISKGLISHGAMSDFFVVQSSPNNHHLINLDLMDFKTVSKIAFRFAHREFVLARTRGKDFVLRVSPKLMIKNNKLTPVKGTNPKLIGVVKSPFHYRSKSESLRRFFSHIWDFPIKKDSKFTDSSKFRLHIFRLNMVGDYCL